MPASRPPLSVEYSSLVVAVFGSSGRPDHTQSTQRDLSGCYGVWRNRKQETGIGVDVRGFVSLLGSTVL